MRPQLRLLDDVLVARVLEEALQLVAEPGVRVGAPAARELLAAAGARVDGDVVRIPAQLVRSALASVPRDFALYTRAGEVGVRYGGDHVQFAPGSSCLNILDAENQQPRPAESADLIRLVQVAEQLPQYASQSTALVCHDVPNAIGDLYRLFLVLLHSDKPVVTGAFSAAGLQPMLQLLAADSGSEEALRERPRAIFDVCPSPPLHWSGFAAQNLVELARASVPAEVVSMPLAGATAPVTLIGSVVQHAAECLSGITIHQLAGRGAPIVWGGAPAIFDMRHAIAPMGAIETTMLNLACCDVGKSLNLPTHGYLVASDSRAVDAQAGAESGVSAALGALAGMNMISGAGMLDSLACHSLEKLVIDAEAIAATQRLAAGIEVRGDTLALGTFRQTGLRGNFLSLAETRALFRGEQHFPSAVIQRGPGLPGQDSGADTLARAHNRLEALVAGYERPRMTAEVQRALRDVTEGVARRVGLDTLPALAALA